MLLKRRLRYLEKYKNNENWNRVFTRFPFLLFIAGKKTVRREEKVICDI